MNANELTALNKQTEEIARRLNFYAPTRTSEYRGLYEYKFRNIKGETLEVSFGVCSGDRSAHSLAVLWYKHGYTKKVILDWWNVTCYVTTEQGLCVGDYNPTHKLTNTFDVNSYTINFDWHLAATAENFEKLMTEIVHRFLTLRSTHDDNKGASNTNDKPLSIEMSKRIIKKAKKADDLENLLLWVNDECEFAELDFEQFRSAIKLAKKVYNYKPKTKEK